ncbi:CG0192-related protein [Nocardioides sp. MAHUQ-72]|uniref:CG0192-related protein n=1 Tax=unclassified Nocardioides TaxID=2615069 RepID=UPI00360F4F5E
MALLHKATLSPTKRELMDAWLPGRGWSGGSSDLRPVGGYRFDDPAGEVGIEGFLLGDDAGPVLHLPLTYRAAPLAGAEEHLVGTTEHSVLGRRWVYDACGDPIWATALATAVLTGGTQAEEYFEVDGRRETRESGVAVQGSGMPGTAVPAIDSVTCHDDRLTTVVRAGGLELVVVRRVGADVMADHTLTGRWSGGRAAVLAGVRLS